MRLRRRLTLSHDGRPFLDRWGFVHERLGGIYLHHIAGPDPGYDLHDHPWWFCSIVLAGGYHEARCSVRAWRVGLTTRERRRWSVRSTGFGHCHRIINVLPGTWTLVLRGPTRQRWGFYLPDGWVDFEEYPYETRRPSTITQRR